jgi:chorismate-pyruvate lyase
VTVELPIDDPRRMLRRALAEHATVTGFLEDLTGEHLVADVMSQCAVPPDPADGLAVAGDGTVIRRIARLRGQGGAPYLYAETELVPARLPPNARRRLAHGTDPIGRVLLDEGLTPVQLPAIAQVPPRCPEPLEPEVAAAVVWRRAYRLALGGRPVFAIAEWFLQPVLDALALSRHRLTTERSRS